MSNGSEGASVARVMSATLVDYAGLFPPAQLDMSTCVANYAGYRRGSAAALLGRFVLPAARVEEFITAARFHVAERALGLHALDQPWELSLLVAQPTELQAARASLQAAFGLAVVVASVELPPLDALAIEPLVAALPRDLEAYVEVPLGPDQDERLALVAQSGAYAKVRTGGVSVDAFPRATDLAAFLGACAARRLPFKATAGLHHACRGAYPLTYERGSASAPMYGFLNLFVATAEAQAGADLTTLEAVLLDPRPQARVSAAGVMLANGRQLSAAELRLVRSGGLRSFGSCSFNEPVGELCALGLA
jgi:hypothetical protein